MIGLLDLHTKIIEEEVASKTWKRQRKRIKLQRVVVKLRELEGICSEPASEIDRKDRINVVTRC